MFSGESIKKKTLSSLYYLSVFYIYLLLAALLSFSKHDCHIWIPLSGYLSAFA